MENITTLPVLSYKTSLCREADTRDCSIDTQNRVRKEIFVCRSPILVCQSSTQPNNFCLYRICVALRLILSVDTNATHSPKAKKVESVARVSNLYWILCVCHLSVNVLAMYRAHRPFASAPLHFRVQKLKMVFCGHSVLERTLSYETCWHARRNGFVAPFVLLVQIIVTTMMHTHEHKINDDCHSFLPSASWEEQQHCL
jgi:hypothetical protein